MGVKTLTVDRDHVTPTLLGVKWLTVRYDDEKYIRKGDTLRLVDPDGECFALATVEGTLLLTVNEFINFGFPYYRKYDLKEFLEMMNSYYDDPISRYTECKVISYDVSTIMGDYRERQAKIYEFEEDEE